MKNVIAISAHLKYCSVAISYEGRLYEANEDIDAASNLVWLANNLVKLHHIDLQKVDGIITAAGPGSFTGIRAAQSFAKGLALSLRLPAASVPYFDVIASIVQHPSDAVIVIKSEKNQVYYRINNEIGISSVELLADKISDGAILMGDAVDEIVLYMKNKIVDTIYVDNFRKAKYLLKLSHKITRGSMICPLYIHKQRVFI
jgi:tRNA threonylcarbamoyl adenosine modification protein YeaZ